MCDKLSRESLVARAVLLPDGQCSVTEAVVLPLRKWVGTAQETVLGRHLE